MESLKNAIGKAYRSVAVNFKEILKDSKFYTHGVLTPSEFIIAGDQLVLRCPTWKWESGKKELKSKNLPEDRQYLITRNVPCPRRVKDLDMNQDFASEKGFDGNWMVPQPSAPEKDHKVEENVIDIDYEEEKSEAEENALREKFASQAAKDIDELEKDSEPDIFVSKPQATPQDFYKTRTYDISITYDFYYQTPRLWLTGYSEKGEVLSKEKMYEDIMSDYADKTVTLEQHPHQGIQCISIHPCKHALLMKHIIDTITANGGKAEVWQAMFVFLKFISSIIPTIDYDFTIDTELK